MNGKISSLQVFAISIVIISTMFYVFVNTQLLSISKNSSLLIFLISTIIGLIPVFMISFISKKINTSLFLFLKEKFKVLGYITNIVLIIISIYLIFITSFVVIDFIISQFLTKNSYYILALFFSFIAIIAIHKGIEAISRTIFILFIISLTIVIISFISLTPYLEIDNFKPLFDSSINNSLKGLFITTISTTAPLIYILNIKSITINKNKFSKNVITGYLLVMIIAFLFLFFLIGVYGIDLAKILTYPSYALFKKIQIFGVIERIENIFSIIFINIFASCFIYLLYCTKKNITEMFNIKNKKKVLAISAILSIMIPILSIYLFKTYEINNLIYITPYILIILYIIIFIIFARCLFLKN